MSTTTATSPRSPSSRPSSSRSGAAATTTRSPRSRFRSRRPSSSRRRTARRSGPRRGDRDRTRGPRRRPALRPTSPGSTTCRGWSTSPGAEPRPRGSRRLRRGGCREPAVRGRLVRLRAVRDRRDVHRRPPAGRRRAGARVPPRRPDRSGELDAAGFIGQLLKTVGAARPTAAVRGAADPLGHQEYVRDLLGQRRVEVVRRTGDGHPAVRLSGGLRRPLPHPLRPDPYGGRRARRERSPGAPGRPGRAGRGREPGNRRHLRHRLGVPGRDGHQALGLRSRGP